MARFLTTLPENLGFWNLGTVQAYPTGGSGPVAYGSTGIFGSSPLPATDGDSLYNSINLGDFSSELRTITLTGTHGGLTRRQSTFYKIVLHKPRSVQFTQNFSQFSYTSNTNRNTLLSVYKVSDGTKRVEIPISDSGYAYDSSGIEYDPQEKQLNDYPTTQLPPGEYTVLITNDIRYQETNFSISVTVGITDWGLVTEIVDSSLDFRFVDEAVDTVIDLGTLAA